MHEDPTRVMGPEDGDGGEPDPSGRRMRMVVAGLAAVIVGLLIAVFVIAETGNDDDTTDEPAVTEETDTEPTETTTSEPTETTTSETTETATTTETTETTPAETATETETTTETDSGSGTGGVGPP